MEKKLRIAIVLNRFFPSSGGQSYFSFLAKELSKRGHDVTVFTSEAEERNPKEYKLRIIPVIRWPRTLRIISYILSSKFILSNENFDIIHQADEGLTMNVFNPHGGVEKAYLKQEFRSIESKPYLVVRLLRRYLSPYHYLTMLIQHIQFRSKSVKKIIAISKMVKEHIIEYYGVPEDKISYVFNTCDMERFRPENRELYGKKIRKELGIKDDSILLMFAGHNFRLKGLKVLLRALSAISSENRNDVFLLVAGRGRIEYFRKMAKKLDIEKRVIFLGPVREIEKYYAASDIYVHPTFYDSCSLSVLEALSSGLPVVTTRFNGAKDAIRSRDGGIVLEDPSSYEELKSAISYFFDPERRRLARSLVRSWMEEYSPEKHMERILKVYSEVKGSP